MNIRLFNKNYWIRRFKKQEVIKGYISAGYADFGASLHLHPLGTDEMLALPEGQRKIKRLEGHGEIELLTADQTRNQKGDMVYYHGAWYECEMCQMFDHTLLSHYNYQFVQVPMDGAVTHDLQAPTGDPVVSKEGSQ